MIKRSWKNTLSVLCPFGLAAGMMMNMEVSEKLMGIVVGIVSLLAITLMMKYGNDSELGLVALFGLVSSIVAGNGLWLIVA